MSGRPAFMLTQEPREHSAPYGICKNLLSRAECAKMIEFSKGLPKETGKVHGNETVSGVTHRTSPLIRRTELSWLGWSEESDWLFQRLSGAVTSANEKWWGFHLNAIAEPLQITHYKSEDLGFYDWHEDRGDAGLSLNRKLSCVMLLNDDFEGGAFEFFNLGSLPAMSVGTLVVFPSFKVHRVTPVTQGERWSLVSWINGPPFL